MAETKAESNFAKNIKYRELIITRIFDAPRELVFKAFIDPEIYAQWIGPRGLTTTFETFEPRNGGSWRYIKKDTNGNEFAFHGVNHEELSGNRTKLTSQSVFHSVADHDGMLQSGMEEGINDPGETICIL